ncbi:hypothetical protein BCR42DRAFT_448296 [Absidia repens]|uniref:Uncharacterized protein n=1 Tax=Absidia repens TaxID=90262 RepID=A0A1X2ISE0_9FUNG|nr:hypothetical protein BCR42DRAFT_448296 [Absidia repens]
MSSPLSSKQVVFLEETQGAHKKIPQQTAFPLSQQINMSGRILSQLCQSTSRLIQPKTPSNPNINPIPKRKSLTAVDPFLESRNVANFSTEMGWARIKREFRRAANMLINGGSFEQVLEEYWSVEYYDPDCIKNRVGSRA